MSKLPSLYAPLKSPTLSPLPLPCPSPLNSLTPLPPSSPPPPPHPQSINLDTTLRCFDDKQIEQTTATKQFRKKKNQCNIT